MQNRPLGRTGIDVSAICLGSMTWGTQNTEAEGHQQIDYALSEGVNFIDTAEMYPVNPTSAETQGRTEEIVGSWFRKTGRRSDVVLATKITGKGIEWVRGGAPITGAAIREAIDGSLKRLQTDYIDLYQLHWPNRDHYHFRKSWSYDPSGSDRQQTGAHIQDVLGVLGALKDAGKIRAIGLSNETCWGTGQFLRQAEDKGLPRVASIQNEYSLLQRLYDLDLAELSINEDVGLLAFSPLAAGLLTGKYRGGAIPPGSRRSLNEGLGGRYTPAAVDAVDAYCGVAGKHGLDPAQMALSFCLSRPFMASVIIGATSMDQLRTNIASKDLRLDDDILSDIASVHRRFPIPM